MLKTWKIGKRVRCSSFATETGSQEFFLAVNTASEIPFDEALERLSHTYQAALKECGLSEKTQVFVRFYLSDIANQKDDLSQSEIFNFTLSGACSTVQQCPLNGGSISLLAYHIKGKTQTTHLFPLDSKYWRNGVKVQNEHYSFYWMANYSGFDALDSFEQTNEIFSSYDKLINDHGMTLLNNTVRTWVYVRDVDNNYKGMVESRKDYFEQQGLTRDTRYIASTGIEGKLREVHSLVSMDALSISNLQPEQIVRMEALEHLCPTHDYGVTFERGTKIIFGDRSHMYISGTASIDKHGDVLHLGNVRHQTKRTLENIEALLAPHGANLNNMAYLIVYIRNITEVNKVTEMIKEYVTNDIPMIVVEGAVCRPSWLVEMEGVAILSETTDFAPF